MWEAWLKHLRGAAGGRWAGTGFGLVCAILYLIVGFWDMLVFAMIVGVGFYIGWSLDRGQLPFRLNQVLEWMNERWRGFK